MEEKKLSKSEKNLLLNMFEGAVDVSRYPGKNENLFLLVDHQGKKMFCWLKDSLYLSYFAIYTDRTCFFKSQQSFFLQDQAGKDLRLAVGQGSVKFTAWFDEIYETLSPLPLMPFALALIAGQKRIVRLSDFSVSEEIPNYFKAELLEGVANEDFYLCTFRDGEQAILKLSTLQLSLKTSFSQITVIPEYGIQLSLRNGVKALLSFSSFSLSPWQF
jgi:hypothetical protein